MSSLLLRELSPGAVTQFNDGTDKICQFVTRIGDSAV